MSCGRRLVTGTSTQPMYLLTGGGPVGATTTLSADQASQAVPTSVVAGTRRCMVRPGRATTPAGGPTNWVVGNRYADKECPIEDVSYQGVDAR